MKKIRIPKKVSKKEFPPNQQSMMIFERIKQLLDNQGKNVEWLSLELGIKSRSTLYVAFRKGTITITMLNNIAEILNVHPGYFFEDDVIERLTEVAARYSQNPDLKSFLMGFSRDLNKGMPLERAASKNIDPQNFVANQLI